MPLKLAMRHAFVAATIAKCTRIKEIQHLSAVKGIVPAGKDQHVSRLDNAFAFFRANLAGRL